MKKRFDIRHLAHLSRLDLSKNEKEKFSSQLSEILDYFKKLQAVKTKDSLKYGQSLGLENIYREDVCEKSLSPKEIFQNANDKKRPHFKVGMVLGNDE
ncbi:MAG: aspartyl-tRNA(Asn)/glutamyl-tRNA (Gln) amidotransferase subunit C [Candidatus Berkelbacteria bacterium Licking1014_7]|uniref:Aspartyl/glutamyl-tRNA(Asn/Gln) amidotransferase subunit C n=1 Tax=Candidatus Berkelbacteria bacterium Licking1014_7 TaxID=2017147 RepID=A0A554LIA9_9BACT|nr:MAG: aspartyl-tRNA(Asn)/glutamyl-tRNA (Gln) amidotransferase subunit C [Candidatus Berkelbacteria bacterium Licking1014_7]